MGKLALVAVNLYGFNTLVAVVFSGLHVSSYVPSLESIYRT